jgi:hypothetical protein
VGNAAQDAVADAVEWVGGQWGRTDGAIIER